MKVGDYVRIKDKTGWCCIGKVVKIGKFIEPDVKYCIDIQGEDYLYPPEDIIVKSSPNIIDLVEKNDLVVDNYGNIYVVDYVFDNYIYTTTKQGNIIKTLCDYQIKSIVTKEQFESMEYKVGE